MEAPLTGRNSITQREDTPDTNVIESPAHKDAVETNIIRPAPWLMVTSVTVQTRSPVGDMPLGRGPTTPGVGTVT